MTDKQLHLLHNLLFEDLYSADGIRNIDKYFLDELEQKSHELHDKLLSARRNHSIMHKLQQSELIIALAPYLEDFIVKLFDVHEAMDRYRDLEKNLSIVQQCNKHFIQKDIAKITVGRAMINEIEKSITLTITALRLDGIEIPDKLKLKHDELMLLEIQLAESFMEWYSKENIVGAVDDDVIHQKTMLQHARTYSLWALHCDDGKMFHRNGCLFLVPQRLDHENLIPHLVRSNTSHASTSSEIKLTSIRDIWQLSSEISVPYVRSAFIPFLYATTVLTNSSSIIRKYNNRMIKIAKKNVLQKPIYLSIDTKYFRKRKGFCLNDDAVSLSNTIHEVKYCLYCHNRDKDSCSHGMKLNQDEYKENALKNKLHGCPLSEKISEMNWLKAHGFSISALATVVIDNPMVAATGHRICNDCMKACIFQKQKPVDIPLVETQLLQDVLGLPWGFEIYSLLTRWNPLNFASPWLKHIGKHKVLVVGLGPAGFTLAHYLLNAGVNVVAVDGLKIEPLPPHLSGITIDGKRQKFTPIHSIDEVFEDLSERKPSGFGGVMEYGITVRWDKNMLNVIRLLLERRRNFRMYGGIRFGSNIHYDFCQNEGFDHIALAVGAGQPNVPEIPNVLVKGVRMASDFLMSLQLSGAYRYDNITPLQVRMPIVVIGAGLTAVDSATEAIQYYMVQVEKFLQQYEMLGVQWFNTLEGEDREIAIEFIKHGRQLRENPHMQHTLLQRWGGVTVLYRGKIQDSPAYRVNHEELSKAFEEGIKFIENGVPQSIRVDRNGNCAGISYSIKGSVKKSFIYAKSIIIATGTHPNTTLAYEDSRLACGDGIPSNNGTERNLYKKIPVSYFGDANPKYNGSVVKAMASAKDGYKKIVDSITNLAPNNPSIASVFFSHLDDLMLCRIKHVKRLTHNAIEVIVHAPLPAMNFKPGQFFRLQKYESHIVKQQDTKFHPTMEGIALTGASVDRKNGLISLVVLEMGVSSKLCNTLLPEESVVLMGPTGEGTTIPKNEVVLLIGGGLGNAVLLSIGKKMREQGCKILYFAGYKKAEDVFKMDDVENAADIVVWCCDEGIIRARRSKDQSFNCNILQAIDKYSEHNAIKLSSVNRMLAIGSDGLMSAVAKTRKILQHHHRSAIDGKKMPVKCTGTASINSPMQCMMKGICAQCLQKHNVHIDGKVQELYMYSCRQQDQNIDHVDFEHLSMRLQQNHLLERTADTIFNLQQS